MGPTGAGKTTVINLFTRFYDVDGGSVSIDWLGYPQEHASQPEETAERGFTGRIPFRVYDTRGRYYELCNSVAIYE